MKFVPNSVSRLGGRTLLKLSAASPTILVVSGVVGLGATAVLASKASRKIDPILDEHKKTRDEFIVTEAHHTQLEKRARQKQLGVLYAETSVKLVKLYAPTLIVGTASAVAVLGGHNILRTRHVAALTAYSGLFDQFNTYRKRVADSFGEDIERGIYEGARGEWVEDPDHKGEYKLENKFDPDNAQDYLRPWFDEVNVNFTRDPMSNYLFLKGVQSHMNNLLQARGHVFLNECLDGLRLPRCPEGQFAGWVYNPKSGDNYIDFGFMTGVDPHTVAFRNQRETTVKLNFNIQGSVWNLI